MEGNTGNGAASVTTAPTAKTGLIAASTAQVLLATAGIASNGAMQYKVDSGNWTSDLNQVTGTAAGTYTVYYKAVAAANSGYTDSAEASLPVVIGNAANSGDSGNSGTPGNSGNPDNSNNPGGSNNSGGTAEDPASAVNENTLKVVFIIVCAVGVICIIAVTTICYKDRKRQRALLLAD
jgi:hypothetical protein